jgi:hypothetical protein
MTPELLPELVRSALLYFVVHEVDEAITVAGHRPFDPHRGEPP